MHVSMLSSVVSLHIMLGMQFSIISIEIWYNMCVFRCIVVHKHVKSNILWPNGSWQCTVNVGYNTTSTETSPYVRFVYNANTRRVQLCAIRIYGTIQGVPKLISPWRALRIPSAPPFQQNNFPGTCPRGNVTCWLVMWPHLVTWPSPQGCGRRH